MKIAGYLKTTLLDYPGHLAAVVFTQGCNMRCPFCHNKDLLELTGDCDKDLEKEWFAFLQKRRGLLEGVCVTGGEPTLQPGLERFLKRIKELGYLVKLDTNGTNPGTLERLLAAGYVDYAAMDIKAGRQHYSTAAGTGGGGMEAIYDSIRLLLQGGCDYEFRTTVVKGIHEAADFEEIGALIAGGRRYYLQAYRDSPNIPVKGYAAFDRREMEEYAEIARKYIDKVQLRGVE